jgi:hypothetical protein
MESWLEAQGVEAVERPEWQVPTAEDVRPQLDSSERVLKRPPTRPAGLDAQRSRAHDLIDGLSPRDLEAALVYLEFLRERRAEAAPSAPREGRELALVAPGARGGGDRELARDREPARLESDDESADEP